MILLVFYFYCLGTEQINTFEIPSAIKNFIKFFFSCRHCSENFMKETKDMNKLESNNKNAVVIYFWKGICYVCFSYSLVFINKNIYLVHNSVNKRLHGEQKEDPQYPKIQFPPENICSNCYATDKNDDNMFDLPNTLDFLLRYYSKDNIDVSSVEILSISDNEKDTHISRSQRKSLVEHYSMIEINNEPIEKPGLIGSLTSLIQRFPLYFFFSLVILIIFVRRRFCKGKRKRYTL